MADYYSKGTIRPFVNLNAMLYKALETQGASFEVTDDSETVLDGIIKERPPMTEYYIYFEESWSDGQGSEEYLEWAETDDLSPEDLTEFTRLLDLQMEDLLHEILKLNPEVEEIEHQCAHSCSKMRPDGFSGTGLIVNRKGWLYINTGSWEVDADGSIRSTAAFHPWDDECPETPVEGEKEASCLSSQ